MSSKKITGFVAWHPVEGVRFDTIGRAKQSAEDRLIINVMGFKEYPASHARAEVYFAMRDRALIRASNDNWQIRPIQIVFTDEGAK